MPHVPGPWLAGDVGLATWLMTLQGQRLMMVQHFRVKASGTGNYMDDSNLIVSSLEQNLTGPGFWRDIVLQQSDNLHYTAIRVQKIWPQREVYIEALTDTPGALVGESAPANLAMTINKRTLLPGRKGHGTTHIPGLLASKLEGGLWNQEMVDDILLAANGDLTATYEVIGSTMELEWGLFDDEPGTESFEDIVGVNGSNVVTTMHRRTVGLGI